MKILWVMFVMRMRLCAVFPVRAAVRINFEYQERPMSRRLMFSVVVILGASIIAGSITWVYVAQTHASSDPQQALACAAGKRATIACGAADPVIRLRAIVVTPTPEEERYAESRESGRRMGASAFLLHRENVSGKIDRG